jgi:hypothetical protein
MKEALLKAPGSLLSIAKSRGLISVKELEDPRIQSAIDYLEGAEPAIEGQNGSRPTFAAACRLVHAYGLSRDVSLRLLEAVYNPRCIPPWDYSQLAHKVDDAIKRRTDPTSRKSIVAPLSSNQIQQNITKVIGTDLLSEAEIIGKFGITIPEENSSNSCADQTRLLISSLFKPGELVGIVLNSRKDGTKYVPANAGIVQSREKWIQRISSDLESYSGGGAWIRMNPLSHKKGKSDNDVKVYRYTLVEFDHITPQQQLNLLVKLELPIDAITWSGARSYHAWVRVDAHEGVDDYRNQVSRLHQSLRLFGVDTNTRNPSRMSRLPGVKRGKEQQRLIYVNKDIIL